MDVVQAKRALEITVGLILLGGVLGGAAAATPRPLIGISRAQSRALSAVPGTLLDITLDSDRGRLVYKVEIASAGVRDVEVTAHTGRVLRITWINTEPARPRDVEAP